MSTNLFHSFYVPPHPNSLPPGLSPPVRDVGQPTSISVCFRRGFEFGTGETHEGRPLLPRYVYDLVYNLESSSFMIFAAGYCMESSRFQSRGYHYGCSILWRQGTPIHRLPGHGCASDDGMCLSTTGRREQPMCTYVPTNAKRLLQEIPIGGTSDWIPSTNSSATRLFPCWDCRKNGWKRTGCYGKFWFLLYFWFDLYDVLTWT